MRSIRRARLEEALMATQPKIRFTDDVNIRKEIDALYETTHQIVLAKWSLSVAKHILSLVGIDYDAVDEIADGFHTNEMWQSGYARMHDVRQAGFKIHQLAREADNEIRKIALRTAGQAVGSGHMREHSMVTSDYAIKVIGLLTSNNQSAISKERNWQLNELKKIINGSEMNPDEEHPISHGST
jgi:hypothetical protein